MGKAKRDNGSENKRLPEEGEEKGGGVVVIAMAREEVILRSHSET